MIRTILKEIIEKRELKEGFDDAYTNHRSN